MVRRSIGALEACGGGALYLLEEHSCLGALLVGCLHLGA
jgi:hypothetical protein